MASDRGHEVTIFTRGRTNPGLFPDAEHLIGNRDGDLHALRARTWDAVVDTCGYVPRVVRDSVELLADSVDHYTFVSSGSVYAEPMPPGYDESSPVQRLGDDRSEDVERNYGALKAACERVVLEAVPGRALVVRAGLIVGPHDPTGRFTYWVHRIARGGRVLAPEPRGQAVQFVDVRDLAAWMLDASEQRVAGTMNAVGPEEPRTMRSLLEGMRAAFGSSSQLVWVDESFLLQRDVNPWSNLPLWLAPGSNRELETFMTMNAERALASGLRFRPLEETVRDTLTDADPVPEAGLAPDRERALLDAWATHG